MSKSDMVNVKMVITEEKILNNIEKVQKMINPNSKKQIIELEEDSYFKDLIESIKTYLIEYPEKDNFPKSVYDAAYESHKGKLFRCRKSIGALCAHNRPDDRFTDDLRGQKPHHVTVGRHISHR